HRRRALRLPKRLPQTSLTFLLRGWFMADSVAPLSTPPGGWSAAARHAPPPILLGAWFLADSVGRLSTPPGGWSLAVWHALRQGRSSLLLPPGCTRRLPAPGLRPAIRAGARDLFLPSSRP